MEHLDKLKLLTAWDTAPALTEDELEETLAAAALQDANGLRHGHVENIRQLPNDGKAIRGKTRDERFRAVGLHCRCLYCRCL